MKKIVCLISLAIIMALTTLLVSGCGDGRGSLEDLGDNVFYDNKNNELYVESKEGKEEIKISFSSGWGDNWLKQVGKIFLLDNSHYYIKLDMDAGITAGVSSKLEAGRNLSDIYMVLASNWQSYAALGQLENLNDLYDTKIPGEDEKVGEKITGTWKGYGKSVYQNKEDYFIMPWNENITGLVYNVEMFEKYGWNIPETVEELIALCEEIIKDTNGTVAPFVYPGQVSGGYLEFLGQAWWLQASGVDGCNDFFKFDSPNVYNPAVEPSRGKLKSLYAFDDVFVQNAKKYNLAGSASKDHLAAQISFGMGEAAMIPNGNWIENESGDDIPFTMKMMSVPYLDGAKTDASDEYIKVNYTGQPDYMFIPANAKNKVGAKVFLAYMCKDNVLMQYTKLTGAPRPFEYNPMSEDGYSEFVKSCLDIWSTSYNWFDNSTSPLYRINKAKKYLTVNPFVDMLYNSTTTPDSWCASEYAEAKKNWDSWLEAAGIK